MRGVFTNFFSFIEDEYRGSLEIVSEIDRPEARFGLCMACPFVRSLPYYFVINLNIYEYNVMAFLGDVRVNTFSIKILFEPFLVH